VRASTVLAGLLVPCLIAGCQAQRTDPDPRPVGAGTDTAGSSAASTGGTDLAVGLDVPWGLARDDDGSYLVSLRDQARVVRVSPAGRSSPVPGAGPGGRVPGVVPEGEGGLLGLAFAPGDTSVLYAYLTSATDNRVVSMPYRAGRLGPATALLTGVPKAGRHNGGRLAFGPDGFLYVTTGDAADPARSQDRSSLGGKILRITTDGDPAPGNPFPGSPVWSFGHRNVQGIGWDDDGRMYASEFGQNTWDELNRIEPGRNYGWPTVEGRGDDADAARGFVPPLRQWPTSQASPSGIAVGAGAVWMAALRGERLWRIPLRGDGSTDEPVPLLVGRYGRLRAAVLDPDGSLLLLTDNRSRGKARPGDDRLIRLAQPPGG
jgi:glucose/arabinose dehydrogenase